MTADGKHPATFRIVGEQPRAMWRATCGCHRTWLGSTYEAAEDCWRRHVHSVTGTAPKAMCGQEDRWTPGDAKTEGQALSVAPLSEDAHAAFVRIITNAPHLFSVNDCREQLELAQIPRSARGGLFATAIKAGLIEVYTPGGYPARVQSTGPSAHRATVVLYQRITKGAAA